MINESLNKLESNLDLRAEGAKQLRAHIRRQALRKTREVLREQLIAALSTPSIKAACEKYGMKGSPEKMVAELMAENVWEVRKLAEHMRSIGEMFLGLYLLQNAMTEGEKNWKAIDQLVKLWQAGNTFVSMNLQNQGQLMPGASETPESFQMKWEAALRNIPPDMLTRILSSPERKLPDGNDNGNNGKSTPSSEGV